MKKVFLVHGFNGQPNGGWRPFVMAELGKRDVYACALPMPNPSSPDKNEWVETIRNAVGVLSGDIFLVGHSLGVPAILRYLETLVGNEKIGGAVLVSGPLSVLEKDKYEKVNSFLMPPFNFNHLKEVCSNYVVIHGDDDPVVSFSNAEILSSKLNCELVSIKGGKHLNGGAGVYQLPEVVSALEKMF